VELGAVLQPAGVLGGDQGALDHGLAVARPDVLDLQLLAHRSSLAGCAGRGRQGAAFSQEMRGRASSGRRGGRPGSGLEWRSRPRTPVAMTVLKYLAAYPPHLQEQV